ncbi:MAG: hypothetical protein KDA88_23665 [Planctomycetaceae bacterium]|nr:hypothetical protein [Planctomycetaceae bacterium]MCB9951325.1 hypothetical protein [Planctomycetaceae bacterium]
MAAPRRFSLQLTPLFDLMLIVIFAQYLAVRSGQIEADKVTEQLQSERDAAEQHREQAEATQKVMAELLVELFRVPDEDIADIMAFAERQSPEQRDRIQARFEELANQNSAEAVQHILTYEEIRKRCDIWSLHIRADGVITLQTTDSEPEPVLDVSSNDISVERLQDELFATYKKIPDQKSLVLILLTYERGTRIVLTRKVRALLPAITQQMEEDAGRRSRYDFADMGFAPAS